MHRVGSASLAQRAVYVVAAEQFFFHLPPKCRTDLSIGSEFCQRLVESLGYYRQPACGVYDVPGALLHQEKIVRLAPMRIRWSGDRTQCESTTGAKRLYAVSWILYSVAHV
jgi:hypothetical protein